MATTLKRVDCNLFAGVVMDDAGKNGTPPTDRRYGPADWMIGYERLESIAKVMDRLGYDTMWLTEHHFQYEGYEIIPNQILFGTHLASMTERLRMGQMFNVVPQWHPLRLAEDFAMADVLTRGRMQLGVGRGTVPREAQTLGTVVASGDNEMSRQADDLNREVFEESMEIIKAAFGASTFSHRGKHFVLPPDGIPDRGGFVSELTMVPQPWQERVTIYQPCTSPRTLEYVPAQGFHGVFWNSPPRMLEQMWTRFGDYAAAAGHEYRRGEGRVLVLSAHVGDTRESALATVRDGYDEYIRFLSPYGRFQRLELSDELRAEGYDELPFDFKPEAEESVRQRTLACGSAEDVAETISFYIDLLGIEHISLFLDFPSMSASQMNEQLHRVAEEVMPMLGVEMAGPPAPRPRSDLA